MVFPRCIVFVVAAVALAGCCASSSGCYVPLPGVPTAWDGQGSRPGDGAQPRHPRVARPKTEIIIGPIADAPAEAKPQSEEWWAQKEAADRDADAKLTKRLKICRDCLPPARDDNATGSVSADRAGGASQPKIREVPPN